MDPISQAIKDMGGLTATGKLFGVSRGVVFQWRFRGRIPIPYVPAVEKKTGIPASLLNDKVDWANLRSVKKVVVSKSE